MKKYLMIGFAAVAFAACSNHDFETTTQADIDKAKYDQAFMSYIGGRPAANQDWGFGPSTRAFTRTYNVEGNLWHMAKPIGYNLEYDAPVTNEEKNLVFNYVNDVNNVEKVDQITFTKYWVAQIWNGANDENADKEKAPVSTSYPDQNGATTTTVGGAHMDKLDILEKAGTWTHCNNFNDADNNDWIEAAETGGVEGRTLMWESGTLSFRYINSDGSHMSEKYIIVPGEKIDDSLKGFYYVCFDFEKGYTDEEKANERSYGTCEKWIPQDGNPAGGYWQSENWNLPGFYKDANSEELINTLKTNLGTDIQNITFKGYLYGQQHFDGDDNYTDWIVRISPAIEREGEEGDPSILRIIAEDLSATQASDFDFNDVVLDVTYGNPATVMLVAAGGQLQLKVGSNNGVGGVEVHEALLGADNAKNGNVYKMVSPGGDVWPVTAVDITSYLADADIQDAPDADSKIRIEVFKNGAWELLTAPKGEPSCKLAVDQTFGILRERDSIKDNYTKFVDWARDNNFTSKWWTE